jgi:hypothetical protein
MNPIPTPTEREFAEALAMLVQQADVGDYRDKRGQDLRANVAYLQAQGLVDRYGFTHAEICEALDRGDDGPAAARHLAPVAD